jgi:hypothetical protein
LEAFPFFIELVKHPIVNFLLILVVPMDSVVKMGSCELRSRREREIQILRKGFEYRKVERRVGVKKSEEVVIGRGFNVVFKKWEVVFLAGVNEFVFARGHRKFFQRVGVVI